MLVKAATEYRLYGFVTSTIMVYNDVLFCCCQDMIRLNSDSPLIVLHRVMCDRNAFNIRYISFKVVLIISVKGIWVYHFIIITATILWWQQIPLQISNGRHDRSRMQNDMNIIGRIQTVINPINVRLSLNKEHLLCTWSESWFVKLRLSWSAGDPTLAPPKQRIFQKRLRTRQ